MLALAARYQAGAIDAMLCPWQCIEAIRGDRQAAPDARAEGARIDPRERAVDEDELLLGAISKCEVALLLEDLRRRRGLRAVRHLAGRLDRRFEFLAQAHPLGVKCGSSPGCHLVVHRWMVRGSWSPRSDGMLA